MRIVFRDERETARDAEGKPYEEIYFYEGGIKEYVAYMNAEKDALHPEIIYVNAEKDGVSIEAALQWCVDAYSDSILGSVSYTHLRAHETV